MKYKSLFFLLPLFIIACNNKSNQTITTESKTEDTTKKQLPDTIQADKNQPSRFDLTVKAFFKTADSLHLDKGAFPVRDYLSDNIGDEGYHFALFYLKFMSAASAKDKAKITSMIHFPFQTTKEKLKYNQKTHYYEVIGAENWKGGLLNEKQFDLKYHIIFTDEILENIPETRPKDVIGSLKGDVDPGNDYDRQLQSFTDKGSSIYSVSIELPVKKRNYSHVRFTFGRVNGNYKVLSYFLE